MNIPDKAVEAAAKELYAEGRSTTDGFDMWPEWEDAPEIGRGAFRDEARAALKAAAPFIAAQALRDLANSAEKRSPDDGVSPHWIRRVSIVVQESAE